RHVESTVAVLDERQSLRSLELVGKQQEFPLEMLAVGDDFRGQLFEEKRSFQDAAAHRVGLSLTEPGTIRHRAKEMIDVPDPPADGRLHFVERGKAVPGVAADAAGAAGLDELLCPE